MQRSVFCLLGWRGLSVIYLNQHTRTHTHTDRSTIATDHEWTAQQPHQQQQQQQQQQWTPDLGQQQAALMRGLLVLQQPCRCFSSSAATAGKHKGTGPPWQQAPRLHQPTKHVSGTDPLRTLEAGNGTNAVQPPSSSAEAAAASEAVADGAGTSTSTSSSSTKQSLPHRFRAAAAERWRSVCATVNQGRAAAARLPWRRLLHFGIGFMLLATGTLSAYVVAKQVVLDNCAGCMRSNDPYLQRMSLNRLRSLLETPALFGLSSDVAHELVAKGLLPEIVALIRPGTDAMVLNEMFLLFQGLLNFRDGMKQELQQAGVMQALDKALTEGWLPRGALNSAQALKAKLMPRGLPPAPSRR